MIYLVLILINIPSLTLAIIDYKNNRDTVKKRWYKYLTISTIVGAFLSIIISPYQQYESDKMSENFKQKIDFIETENNKTISSLEKTQILAASVNQEYERLKDSLEKTQNDFKFINRQINQFSMEIIVFFRVKSQENIVNNMPTFVSKPIISLLTSYYGSKIVFTDETRRTELKNLDEQFQLHKLNNLAVNPYRQYLFHSTSSIKDGGTPIGSSVDFLKTIHHINIHIPASTSTGKNSDGNNNIEVGNCSIYFTINGRRLNTPIECPTDTQGWLSESTGDDKTYSKLVSTIQFSLKEDLYKSLELDVF